MAYQQPPGYTPAPGYPPPQQGYPPPQQGYYPPPQQGYYPAPAQQQASSNVVVVQAGQPQQHVHTTTYVERDTPNHLLHCIITLFCPWWIFVWLIVCCIYGC